VEAEVKDLHRQPADRHGAHQGARKVAGRRGQDDREAEPETTEVGEEVLVGGASISTQWVLKGKSA
jgi:hypothetical protein